MSKRIQLLSEVEVSELYDLPEFNHTERQLYFTLTSQELDVLNNYSNIKTRIYFVLQLGYFKAKQNFFEIKFEKVQADVEYILSYFSYTTESVLAGQISRNYINNQKNDILSLFGYRNWAIKFDFKVQEYLCKILKYYPKIHNAARHLLTYFSNEKIIIPSYRKLQDIFTSALSVEDKRLDKIILSMPEEKQKQLSVLVDKKDGISKLNILRADQKNFQYTSVTNEVKKAQDIFLLYEFAKNFIPTLDISKNAVRYYADVAEQYACSRLRRLKRNQQYLYVICFIYHRYQQIMDNLIVTFFYRTREVIDAGKVYAAEALVEHNMNMTTKLPGLALFLKWFPHRNKELSYDELNQEAYKMLSKEQFITLAEFFNGKTFDEKKAKWEAYAKFSRFFALYLRPILVAVPFVFYEKDNDIIKLINILKVHYSNKRTPSALKLADAISLIPKNILPYLKRKITDEKIDPHLFEFFVYQKIYHHLDRGRLCCNDSVSYCDIDCDLIDDALVDRAEEVAAEFGYSKIPIYCDERLDTLIAVLDDTWDVVTNNINTNSNPGFNLKINKEGKQDWSLLYDASKPLDDAFFKTLPKIEIADVIMFIGDKAGMWSRFTHMKDRYTKRKTPNPLAINACLLLEAFGFSIAKMAEMSDINLNLLRATHEDFIRVDTLCATNDTAANYIHSLPIFKKWNLIEDKILADADGQKFATSENTIQSRYSKKYLGKGKGISLYTLIANFVAVNAKNIGLNEYEGHSLYDMVYGNKTDIDIDMVTGDNHSLNQLNFMALDSINIDYVPSIKNVREAANDLYSVKSPSVYTSILKPKSKINVDRIKAEKRGILRVLLSLVMQANTQSNIIRKLNSHTRYARLRAALFEYNKIFKSIHVLNLINDMQLRKAIRTARNRTEAYHQLQRLIRKIYSGIFKGQKVIDNRISAHAARLIANCAIACNSIILNAIYEKMIEDNVDQKVIDEFLRISPIAWTHILFAGKYNFKKITGNIDIIAMVSKFEKHLKQYFWVDRAD